MSDGSILFAHGLNGSPQGSKATLLRNRFNAITPALHHLELPEQVHAIVNLMSDHIPWVLIGSSLGALAVLGAACQKPQNVRGLILLAPAFDLELKKDAFTAALVSRPCLIADASHYSQFRPPPGMPCHVVQGLEDELFSIDSAVDFVKQCPSASLTLVHDNHQLEMWQRTMCAFVAGILESVT